MNARRQAAALQTGGDGEIECLSKISDGESSGDNLR